MRKILLTELLAERGLVEDLNCNYDKYFQLLI